MAFKIVILSVALVGLAAANPASQPAFWKGTPMDGMVEEMRSMCSSDNDSGACLKYKIMNFLDTVFKKDNFQVGLCSGFSDFDTEFNRFISYSSPMTSKCTEMDMLDWEPAAATESWTTSNST